MRYGAGYFMGNHAIVSVTTGALRAAFGAGSRGCNLDTTLWPLQYLMHYMGFSVLPPFIFYGVQGYSYSYEDHISVEERLSKNFWIQTH